MLKHLMVEHSGTYVTPRYYLPLLMLSTPALQYSLDNSGLWGSAQLCCLTRFRVSLWLVSLGLKMCEPNLV